MTTTADVTLTELIDVLATTAAKLREHDGAELRRRAEELRDQVAQLGERVQAGGDDDRARRAAAAGIEQLAETVGRLGAPAAAHAGKPAAHQAGAPAAAQAAPPSLDVGAVADALRRFAALLASGDPDSRARIQELLAQLQSTVGAPIGKLFAAHAERQRREDEARRAAIKKDVQASLDEIFRGKKKP